MLKECNNQDLDRNEISGKYYLFFQVWKELTERKTLDSYQYRIMNSLEALILVFQAHPFRTGIRRCDDYQQRNHRV